VLALSAPPDGLVLEPEKACPTPLLMIQWSSRALARDRLSPEGFIEPCQPVLSAIVPSGPDWVHELKHDGWRLLARKDADQVLLWSRTGRNWTDNFPGIVAALTALPIPSCVLDGEAVAHDKDGWPDFHGLQSKAGRERAELVAFDLLMVNSADIRPWPLIERRGWLSELMEGSPAGLHFSEHLENGKALLKHACALNLEGIVSKRKSAPYRSGRSDNWRKIKCPDYMRRK
jgi:bifunctional non-homologous end joining protein LigD